MSYSTYQLQLKWDKSGLHELLFLSYTCNYIHCQLPSCIGLHMSSPPLYMRSFTLHVHTCTGCDTRHHHLYFYRLTTARPSYACSHLSMF